MAWLGPNGLWWSFSCLATVAWLLAGIHLAPAGRKTKLWKQQESVGPNVQVLSKPVLALRFADVLWPKQVSWPRPDKINVDETVGCVSQEAWLMGPHYVSIYRIYPRPRTRMSPYHVFAFLFRSCPFFTQSTWPYLESRDYFFSFLPQGNRCFLFNCLKITGRILIGLLWVRC